MVGDQSFIPDIVVPIMKRIPYECRRYNLKEVEQKELEEEGEIAKEGEIMGLTNPDDEQDSEKEVKNPEIE